MAKVTFGPTLSEARGKAGDTVYTKARGGNVAKALRLTATGAAAGDGANIHRTTDLTLPNNTGLAIPFEAANYDVGGLFDLAGNPTRLTIRKPGVYIIISELTLVVANSGYFTCWIQLNGVEQIAYAEPDHFSDPAPNMRLATLAHFAANDYLELFTYQYTSNDATITAYENYQPNLAVQQLTGV